MDAKIIEEFMTLAWPPEPKLSQGMSNFFGKLKGLRPDNQYTFNAMLGIAAGDVPREPEKCLNTSNKGLRDLLTQACIRAGMIDVMLQFMHFPCENFVAVGDHPLYGFTNQWQAWHSLVRLSRYGTTQEREQFLDKLTDADIVQLCLRTTSHRVLGFRGKPAELLASLASQTFLINRLSARTAAEILRALYTLALQDPQITSDQLTNPETRWLYVLHDLDDKDPWNKTEQSQGLMTSRVFGQVQVSALNAAHQLIIMNTHPSPRYYLDVLKQKPSVIDLLLDCILVEPPHGYPEGTPAYIATNNLAAFFRWPSSMLVPGVPSTVDQALSNKDWKALLQSMQILTSHRDWTERIIEAWMKTEPMTEPDAEDVEKRNRSIADARLLFSEERSQIDSRERLNEDFAEIAGFSRISILRLIITFSHGADATGIRNVDVYPLLPIAYRASQTPHQDNRVICEWPLWTTLEDDCEQDIEPYFVGPESMLGPTAYARLLVVLAQRNALKAVQSLQKPPPGLSPTTSVEQLRQITHPDVIARFLNIAIFRVQSAMKNAEKVSEEDDPNAKVQAGLVFAGAAELAAAMVAFDDLTGGEYAAEEASAARHYLSMALRHISEAATKARRYRRAYSYLVAAVAVADTIKEPRAGWSDFEVKLKKQLRQAKITFETRESTANVTI
ncbi:hypothetical protein CONPUDRAFT_78145 [Coniophora puteana RWD-64-598 SS2]|uniref:Uncharacterized protein n=1 Tax=Coniophora puteana (strain RWD-64-598) TaxID=741705 RepID=R7SDD5_CONPW|nr:uncharacterized protein CONPUDRAFT_78145 [Coniophora puteana RWD-64-598 SS2]EIW74173.1 hypothetical protein CONPUDRAFT_78145 [Coniophora puteana RWD-64-598 SS2]